MKSKNKKLVSISAYEDALAIIEIISEIIEQENPSGIKLPDGINIKDFLHEEFKIVEIEGLDYPKPAAPWIEKQAILYVPKIKEEEKNIKEQRMMAYQKFFFPALNASKIQVIQQIHEMFLSGANSEAISKLNEMIKKRKLKKRRSVT